MDSRCNKLCTEDNATKVFGLIITNPSSEPSEPVDISCVIQDLTAKPNALVSMDRFTDSEPIVINDLDDEEVKTTDENSSKDDVQKQIVANTVTKNIVKESVVKITIDCNDNQKESTQNVIMLDETNADDLNQTKLTSGQLTNKVVQNNNLTTDSDSDLYETELQNAFDANKNKSGIRVKKISQLQDTGKSKQTKKAVCSDNIARKGDSKSDSNIDLYKTESQNVATLNGNREDSDIILLDNKTTSDNTLIPDENEITIVATEYPPINLVDEEDNESTFSHNLISEDYADELKNNSILTDLIQKCLNMESNGGMSRVINRTLLNVYKSVEEEYKKSDALRKVITRTIMKLHFEPEFKFSHIKCFCDHLKLHMVKKKVPFVTLEKRSAGDLSTSTIPSKKRRVDTIDLDNYEVENQTTTAQIKPKEYPPIEIDDSSSSIEEVNDVIEVDNKKTKKKNIKRKKKKKPMRGQALASIAVLDKKKVKGSLAGAFIPTLVRNPFCTIPDTSLKERSDSNGNEMVSVKPNHPVFTHKEPKQMSKSQTESTIRDLSREEAQIISQPIRQIDLSREEAQIISQPIRQIDLSREEAQIISQPIRQIDLSREEAQIISQPIRQIDLSREEGQIISQPIRQIDLSREEAQSISQPLLTPMVMDPVINSNQLHKASKTSEIEEIEKHIGFLREKIEKFEEMEVQVDDETSPYIVSEQYQYMLVKQYKRLCELTGTQEKKQHKVRLHVLPGHPEAPVRYLQEFLNNNIDDEGNPPFPDLYDVIECVSKANLEHNMNWGQARVMSEARSLFIQFGQTMQKRRQKREWKDLMSRVKEEVNDPAEQDVGLMRKLLRNSWIAKKKEDELLDRYASLEQTGLSTRMANKLSATIENGVPEPETESSDDENANPQLDASIQTHKKQSNVGRSVSVTNGSIGIPATHEKQDESLVIPATCEKQDESLGMPATYEKQNESLGIPATCEKRKIVGSAITLSNGYIQIAPTFDAQNSSIIIPNGLITTVPFQLNSNNIFGLPSIQNATNTFVVNDIQNAANTFVVNGIQNAANTFVGNGIQNAANSFMVNDIQNAANTFMVNGIQNAANTFMVNGIQNATNTFVVNDIQNAANTFVVNGIQNAANTFVGNGIQNAANSFMVNDIQNAANTFMVNDIQNAANTFMVNGIQNAANTFVGNGIENVTSPENRVTQSNDLSMYLLEFQKFTSKLAAASNAGKCNLCTGVKRNVCIHNKNVSTVNNRNVRVVNSNAPAVNNNVTPVNSDVTNANKSIVGTAYSDAKVKERTNEKMGKSMCDIFTHKTKPTNKNTVNDNMKNKETPKCTETKTEKINVPNQDNVETSSEINPIEGIVKPEPLDTESEETPNCTEINTEEINVSNQDNVETSSEIETKDNPIEDILKTEPLDTESEETPNCTEINTEEINVSNQDNVETSSEIETKDNPIEDILKPEPLDTESEETPNCTEINTEEINVSNQANVETSSEIETKDVPIEDNVKPEPLDIARMLDALGDEFTAEVFDIEDPFMVIEISDSSESEDEVT